MKLYSTRNNDLVVNVQRAVLEGLAPDRGLYMPSTIPVLDDSFLNSLSQMSFVEIATEVSEKFLGEEISRQDLKGIAERAFNFDAPLLTLDEKTSVLELFHGPTLAFKDFAAHYMAQLVSHFRRDASRDLTILVATSGDTGGAVARGFLGIDGIRVVILYPQGKVSPLQEKQLTTLGHNITALEVKGVFDDCQQMVKEAFVDPDLEGKIDLTSANSINIARLIPQTFYYFRAVAQLAQRGVNEKAIFSVPSGNFGNLTAGLIAKKMGLGIEHFIASSNANDAFVRYLDSSDYSPKPSIATISNAMDVGDPSNFPRLLELHDKSYETVAANIFGKSFSDPQTRDKMKEIYEKYEYVLDPHTAVGFLGLEAFREHTNSNAPGIVLATAHPVKFLETMEEVLPGKVGQPESIKALMNKTKDARLIKNEYGELKEFLLSC
jgi:threonine synthase